MIKKVEDQDNQSLTEFENSTRVYLENSNSTIKVPMREISLSPTNKADGTTEENEPVRVYDTSGAWGDEEFDGDYAEGLPQVRSKWIQDRNDTEQIEGREIKPTDNGYLSDLHDRKLSAQKNELPDFDRSRLRVLKARKGSCVTQLQYAREGIITPEMEFVAIRENMRLQSISDNLHVNPDHDRNELSHQHNGESFGASIPSEITPEFVRSEVARGRAIIPANILSVTSQSAAATKAKNNVPIPTVPPKYHPIETTKISKNALTDAIGKLVFLCKPVIRPSLGPGPKLAIK